MLQHSDGFMPLSKSRYGVAISWDRMKTSVDLDLQAIVVDHSGTIVDAVYFNRLESHDRALMHSGDEKTGEGNGFDEVIWVNLQKLRRNVQLIIFVIGAHNSNSLDAAGNTAVHVLDKHDFHSIESFKVDMAWGAVITVLTLDRAMSSSRKKGQGGGDDGPGSWTLKRTEDTGADGSHFMDILEPTIGDIIRRRIRRAPAVQKVSFPMTKGAILDLPQSSKLENVAVAVGWDVAQSVDLDVSAVLFGRDNKMVGAVYYNNTREFGLHHTGDNTTGFGEGDDEIITVDLTQVPLEITQVFFVVNVYTKDATFATLRNAYCRLTDGAGNEMMRYSFENNKSFTRSGLVMSQLFRCSRTRWGFQAIGQFCNGRKWNHPKCLQKLEALSLKTPFQVQEDSLVLVRKEVRQVENDPDPMRFSTVTLEQDHVVKTVKVGIGWDLHPRVSCDLDVAAVFFHREGWELGACDWENRMENGCCHSGDNKTGDGDGDDEVVSIDLAQISHEVYQIFLVVNVFTKGITFKNVKNAHCRVSVDDEEHVYYRIEQESLSKATESTGLVISQLYRHPTRGWCFKGRGTFCGGRVWSDPLCVKVMKNFFDLVDVPAEEDLSPTATKKPLCWRRGGTYNNVLGAMNKEATMPDAVQMPLPQIISL